MSHYFQIVNDSLVIMVWKLQKQDSLNTLTRAIENDSLHDKTFRLLQCDSFHKNGQHLYSGYQMSTIDSKITHPPPRVGGGYSFGGGF